MSTDPASRVARALDEVRFGPARTLNLRDSLPTGPEAARRTEAWLRERQASGACEVLLITGRGRGSLDGVPIVRETVVRLFPALRRAGVIADVREHTAGSFIVSLAPLQSLVDAPRRRDHPNVAPPADPAGLAALDRETLALLRRLAWAALAGLGVRDASEGFVADEMVRQFTTLAAIVPPGPDRESGLRTLLTRAVDELEEHL